MLYKFIKMERAPYQYEEFILEHEKKFTKDELEKIYMKAYYQIEAWSEGEEYDEDDANIVRDWEYQKEEAIIDYLQKYYGFKRYFVKADVEIFM